MPRSIEVAVDAQTASLMLKGVARLDGIIGLSHQPGASISPPGDLVKVTMVNESTREVLDLLRELGVPDTGSISMSEPTSFMAEAHQAKVNQESNETVWDEMAFLLRNDTNPTFNYMLAMAMAGAIAAGGLWTDTLHLIVGAMIIAPAFEPLARIPFALVTGARRLVASGLSSILLGNLMLILGAGFCTVLLESWGSRPAVPLPEQQWVAYWSSFTFGGVLVSAFGAVAGAVVIGGQRAVLTTGVMITLALIPSMALVGVGVVTGDLSLAGLGFLRWAADAVLVLLLSGTIFEAKRRWLHQGRALS